MRIKFLRSVGRKDTLPKSSDNPASLELPFKKGKGGDPVMYVEGEVADLSKDDAEKVIKTGIGEETDDPVGLPPPVPVPGMAPIPVTVVEPPKTPAAGHRSAPSANYDDMTVEELHKEAADRQIEGRSALTTKADLLKAIAKDDAKGKK